MTAVGDGVPIWGDKKVLELDSGDSWKNIVNLLCATELYTLK